MKTLLTVGSIKDLKCARFLGFAAWVCLQQQPFALVHCSFVTRDKPLHTKKGTCEIRNMKWLVRDQGVALAGRFDACRIPANATV